MASDHSPSPGGHRSTAGDPELIVDARAGDRGAFEVLRDRHTAAAHRLATLLVGPGEAATTLTQRAFEQIRGNLESGGGPDCAFRLQVLREVRSAAARTGVAPALDEQRSADDPAAVPAVRPAADPFVRKSFLALPERWGSVLWHTEVEHQSDAEVAVLLGMRTSTVSTLAARSRDGLLRGYLAGQVHQLDDPDCAQVLEHLRRFATGGADAVQEVAVRDHLDGCDGCRIAAKNLEVLAGDLGAVLAVVVLGEQGIPYLHAVEADTRGDDARVVALAAGPPARPRSKRLVLVGVALVAVTAAVPALRTGAGSEGGLDSLAAVVLDGPASGAAASTSGTGGPAAAGPGAGTSELPATTAGSTTGRATITTTGVNGLPTRISVSTTTRTGPDGLPITIAVIPGSPGVPATTLTGSVGPSVDSAGNPSVPVFTTGVVMGTSTFPSQTWVVGAQPPGTSGPGQPTGGGATSWTIGNGTTAPGGAGTSVPGATAWNPTQAPGTTAPVTTTWNSPATTTAQPPTSTTRPPADTTTAEPVTPTTSDDPTTEPTTSEDPTTEPTTSEDPTTEPTTSDDPTTQPTTEPTTSDDPTTTEPTTTEPTTSDPTSSEPAAEVVVQSPPAWTVPLVRTVPSTTVIAIRNRTGAAIHAQTLTVVVPDDISVSASGEADNCVRRSSTTFACAVPPLSASARKRPIWLTLTGGRDAESGDIAVSVTGNQQTGEIRVVL